MYHFENQLKYYFCSLLQYIAALELDTDFTLVVDDSKITVINKVTPGPFPGIPNIDFTATHPKGKTRVYFILQVHFFVYCTSHKSI